MAENKPAQWGCRKGLLADLGGEENCNDNCELNLPVVKMWVSFTPPFHKLTAKGMLCTFIKKACRFYII